MRFASGVVIAVVVVLGLGAGFSLEGQAHATVYQLPVFLDGLQESPSVATPATGYADVTFDDVTGQMTVANGTFQDLIGTSNNAHVHGYSAPGVSSGVVFGLTFTNGVNSGTFSGAGVIPSGNIDDVLAGLTYINIHSSFRPAGEIRGQIVIPEPASGVAALCAAGAMLLARRRCS